jgi:hypothetical protein
MRKFEGVATRPTTYFMRDLDDDDDEDENPKHDKEDDYSGILNKLKLYLLEYYEPVQNPRDADFHYSTDEIWKQLLKLFPNEVILRPEMIAQWLHFGGFTFYDFGELRFEWLMKRRN